MRLVELLFIYILFIFYAVINSHQYSLSVKNKNGIDISLIIASDWVQNYIDAILKKLYFTLNKNIYFFILCFLQEEEHLYLKPSSSKTRRIIDLNTLGDQLWCKNCQLPLSLNNRINENIHGLASIFTIQCMKCYNKYKVCTDEQDNFKKFPINSKLAFGTFLSISDYCVILSEKFISICLMLCITF